MLIEFASEDNGVVVLLEVNEDKKMYFENQVLGTLLIKLESDVE